MEDSKSKKEKTVLPKPFSLPNSLTVNVDYYDDEQKKKFKKNKYPLKIGSLVSESVSINTNEFLTYLLFTEQKDAPGFRTFTDFRKRMPKSLALIDGYLQFDGKKMISSHDPKDMDKNLTERLGVAMSLSILNKIHNLTEADWKLIEIKTSEKSLDFYYVSVEKNEYIQVEAKGSTTKDNKKKANASNQKADIDDKKKAEERKEDHRINKYKTYTYGVISVLDNKIGSMPQVWLIDPLSESLITPPRKFKLLTRLQFYWRSLRAISPSSILLHALINRIETLETLDNYNDLDKSILLDRKGKEMIIHSRSFPTKSVIGRNRIIGRIYPYDEKHIYYMGFPRELFVLLIEQNFKKIIEYRYIKKKTKSRMTVKCRIRSDQNKRYMIPPNIDFEFIDKKEEYIEFKLEGDLYESTSGRVFGLLDFE